MNNWIEKVADDERLVRFFETCERLNYNNPVLFNEIYKLHLKWNEVCKKLEIEGTNPKIVVNSPNPLLEEIRSTLDTMSYRQFKELVNEDERRKNGKNN